MRRRSYIDDMTARTHGGHVWRSGRDGNVWSPADAPDAWEDLGAVGEDAV